MRVFKTIISVSATCLVAACGGGGGDGASRASFDELNADYDRLRPFVEFGSASTTVFEPENLPTSGGAVYDSVISFLILDAAPDNSSVEILGDMEITARFGAGNDTISGGADNFSDSLGDSYNGRIDISNGLIFRDNDPDTAAFDADFDGSLVNNTNGDVFELDSIIVGGFHGPNYEYIAGGVRGTITTPDGVLQINDGLDRDGNDDPNPDGDAIFLGER